MGGALEARGIPASGGKLWSEARGEIETERNVLVVKRIHVTYHLELGNGERATVDRVHDFHKDHCPVARTIGKCVKITTSLEISG